jgi:hypothetical protein
VLPFKRPINLDPAAPYNPSYDISETLPALPSITIQPYNADNAHNQTNHVCFETSRSITTLPSTIHTADTTDNPCHRLAKRIKICNIHELHAMTTTLATTKQPPTTAAIQWTSTPPMRVLPFNVKGLETPSDHHQTLQTLLFFHLPETNSTSNDDTDDDQSDGSSHSSMPDLSPIITDEFTHFSAHDHMPQLHEKLTSITLDETADSTTLPTCDQQQDDSTTTTSQLHIDTTMRSINSDQIE